MVGGGGGTYISLILVLDSPPPFSGADGWSMDAKDSLAARNTILQTVRALIANDGRAARAFQALSRSANPQDAQAELALAFVCCIWETSRGLPDRFAEVCDGFASGLTTEQLFANSLRDSRRSQRSYEP